MSHPVRARVAVDVLSGRPAAVAAGIGAALADPGLAVTAVGPRELVTALATGWDADRWSHVEAAGAIEDDADPLRSIRGRRDATSRVAARLVRDAFADAFVSAGPTAVVQAAATFALGALPGATQPSLAVRVARPSVGGSFLLVDAGASTDTDAAQLLLHAVHGSAYLTAVDGSSAASAVLLAAVDDRDRLDLPRRAADSALRGAASLALVTYSGPCSAAQVFAPAAGQRIELVVTDGVTGGVLRAAVGAYGASESDDTAILLGLPAPAVVAAPTARGVARAIALAAEAHRSGVSAVTRVALGRLVEHRRSAAGLAAPSPR